MPIYSREPILIDSLSTIANVTTASGNTNLAVGTVLDPTNTLVTCTKVTSTIANNAIAIDIQIPLQNFSPSGVGAIEFEVLPNPGITQATTGSGGDGVYGYAYIGPDLNWNNYGTMTVQLVPGKWNKIRMSIGDMSKTGTVVWETMAFRYVRFRLANIAGYTGEFYIRNLKRGGFQKPQLVVAFDDIGITTYTKALPICQARKIPISYGVIGQAIGSNDFGGYQRMTPTQMRTINALGGCSFNHSNTHAPQPFLVNATVQQCYDEIAICRDLILQHDLSVNNSHLLYASPYGEFSANYYEGAELADMEVFRLTCTSNGTLPNLGARIDCMNGIMPSFQIMSWTTHEVIEAGIRALIARGGTLILLYHHVVDSPGAQIERSTANFTTDMNIIRKYSSMLNVINFEEYWRLNKPNSKTNLIVS